MGMEGFRRMLSVGTGALSRMEGKIYSRRYGLIIQSPSTHVTKGLFLSEKCSVPEHRSSTTRTQVQICAV